MPSSFETDSSSEDETKIENVNSWLHESDFGMEIEENPKENHLNFTTENNQENTFFLDSNSNTQKEI